MTDRSPLTFEPDVQAALSTYITETFVQELPEQTQINIRAEQAGLPRIELRPQEGWMLYFFTQLIQAQKAVEVGTLAGYSASWIARALPEDGLLYTLELNPKHAEIAEANFQRLGLSDKIEVIVGDALQGLELLDIDTVDLVFIDADKPSYPDYFQWALDHVRSGGLILAHNAFRGGDIIKNPDDLDASRREGIEAVKLTHQRVADDERLTGFVIPAGDGMLVAQVNK